MQSYIYKYKVLQQRGGSEQSAQIRSDAADDDETIRTAHVILDYITLNGAYHVEMDVSCLDGRHIVWIEDGEDVSERTDNYLDRPIRIGSGYQQSEGTDRNCYTTQVTERN